MQILKQNYTVNKNVTKQTRRVPRKTKSRATAYIFVPRIFYNKEKSDDSSSPNTHPSKIKRRIGGREKKKYGVKVKAGRKCGHTQTERTGTREKRKGEETED